METFTTNTALFSTIGLGVAFALFGLAKTDNAQVTFAKKKLVDNGHKTQ